MSPEIIILAMIAAFLGLRLYSVLGKRTGHEQEPMAPRSDRQVDRRADPQNSDRAPRPAEQPGEAADMVVPARSVPTHLYDARAEEGIRRLLSADKAFDVSRFVEGAKSAYGMILEAFWTGDRDTLRELCDGDVYSEFETVLDERKESGETLENRLVRIEGASIMGAELNGSLASLTIRFDADIAAVVRNSEGELIAGSLTDAVETHDLWTFERDIASGDPNWILSETDTV